MTMLPRAGDVVRLGRAASPQFRDPILFRVIRVDPSDTADRDGWYWIDGYQLDAAGYAVERRSLFVQITGVVPAATPPPAPAPAGRQRRRPVKA